MKKYKIEKYVGDGSTVSVGHHICIPKIMVIKFPKTFKAGYHTFKKDGKEGNKICYKRIK